MVLHASISSYNLNSGDVLTSTAWNWIVNEIKPVAAKYSVSSNQSFPHWTNTIVNFDSIDYDSNTAVTTWSNWKFTAPKDWLYRVTTSFNTNSVAWWASDSMWIWTKVNGTYKNLIWGWFIWALTNAGNMNWSSTYNLTSGDYLQIDLTIWRPGWTTLNWSNLWLNWVTIERVGDKIN